MYLDLSIIQLDILRCVLTYKIKAQLETDASIFGEMSVQSLVHEAKNPYNDQSQSDKVSG